MAISFGLTMYDSPIRYWHLAGDDAPGVNSKQSDTIKAYLLANTNGIFPKT